MNSLHPTVKTLKREKRREWFFFIVIELLLPIALFAFVWFFTELEPLELVQNATLFRCALILDLVVLIIRIETLAGDPRKEVLSKNEMEHTSWLSQKALKKIPGFSKFYYPKAARQTDGIVISARETKKGIEILTTEDLHALIVGTTGSGKTTGFVDQNISVLSSSKTKPSLLIADPKKELYTRHGGTLVQKGYKVLTLDLRDPYGSISWNPMEVLTRRLKELEELESHLELRDGKYYAKDRVYLTYEDARTRRAELLDEVQELSRDLVYTLCPVRNKDQPTWEEGARSLILAMLLAFTEDILKGTMPKECLTLENLLQNITRYANDPPSTLKEYLLDKRDRYSPVPGLAKTVLITEDRTLTSYLSEVHGYMQKLTDDGILHLTSKSDFELREVDQTPTAIFLVIPDEKATRHPFATLFIRQFYKELVDTARENERLHKTKEATLLRHTYFILDEFGNLPKMEGLDHMVTVARSRGIRFLLVLQSFSQLSSVYGKEVAATVKSNCNVKIYIGSDDFETRKEFSELCGQVKASTYSVSDSTKSSSSSYAVRNMPLVTTGMLERLNGITKGYAVISIRGYEPILGYFTPSYKLKAQYYPVTTIEITPPKESLIMNLHHWDISGPTDEERMEEQLAALEQEEATQLAKEQEEEQSYLEELDRKWFLCEKQMRCEIANLIKILPSKYGGALEECKLEDLLVLLETIKGECSPSYRQDIQETKDQMEHYLQNLFQLEEEALIYERRTS